MIGPAPLARFLAGHEWPFVIAVGLVEGSLPIVYADTPALIKEERRALYTAVTRASRTLVLSAGPALVVSASFSNELEE